MTETKKGIVETLCTVDVSASVKEKNGNKYLPWASCWEVVLSHYPKSYFTVYKQQIVYHDENKEYVLERPWFTSGTGWVEVEVHIVSDDEERVHREIYPILDYKNASIPEDKITIYDVNKSLKRGLVKAVAIASLLGISLFYGEDLPFTSREIEQLVENVKNVAAAKATLSTEAQNKVRELCKKAERKANPTMDEDLISGNYTNIDDIEILTELYTNLLAIRAQKKTKKESD